MMTTVIIAATIVILMIVRAVCLFFPTVNIIIFIVAVRYSFYYC